MTERDAMTEPAREALKGCPWCHREPLTKDKYGRMLAWWAARTKFGIETDPALAMLNDQEVIRFLIDRLGPARPAQASGEPLSDADRIERALAVYDKATQDLFDPASRDHRQWFARHDARDAARIALLTSIAAALGPQGGAEPDPEWPQGKPAIGKYAGPMKWPDVETPDVGPQALGPGEQGK